MAADVSDPPPPGLVEVIDDPCHCVEVGGHHTAGALAEYVVVYEDGRQAAAKDRLAFGVSESDAPGDDRIHSALDRLQGRGSAQVLVGADGSRRAEKHIAVVRGQAATSPEEYLLEDRVHQIGNRKQAGDEPDQEALLRSVVRPSLGHRFGARLELERGGVLFAQDREHARGR